MRCLVHIPTKWATNSGRSEPLHVRDTGCITLWIRRQQNVIILGPTGFGKSYVACALAHKACLEYFKSRYYRLSRLLEALQT